MWHAERKYRITASSVGQICRFTEKRDKKAFAQGLIDPKPLNKPPIIWGKSKEVMAKDAYQQKTGNNIQQCGLFVSIKEPYLASSPDGLIAQTTVLEVKCPWSIRNSTISPENYKHIQYVKNDGSVRLKKSSPYYYQVQTQLFTPGRDFCDFFIWTTCDNLLLLWIKMSI
ncbi:unnamed protein product [Ceutorhynchus assimilis]|uniref:YqaJ viral recombinase domain-containing protein n=1 Tax=Ceutorhynchus assimilis TaxID=467358 RepID=A0A9N9QLP2_9CUCU|nr:unnamed protein product [Ceutorhynchus assimilis]